MCTKLETNVSERVGTACLRSWLILGVLSVVVVVGARFEVVQRQMASLRDAHVFIPESDRSIVVHRPGETLTIPVRLVNVCGDEITVIGAKSNCGCVLVDGLPLEISPGRAKLVHIRLESSERKEPYSHSVRFFLDRLSTAVVLTLNIRYEKPVEDRTDSDVQSVIEHRAARFSGAITNVVPARPNEL